MLILRCPAVQHPYHRGYLFHHMNIFWLLYGFLPGISYTLYVWYTLLASLTHLSQTWNSWKSSLRDSTGSSWSVEAAVRLSPSTPERAVLTTDSSPRRTTLFPRHPYTPASCQCCFKITPPLCMSLPLSCLIVLSHPTNSLAWYRRLCPSDHTPPPTPPFYSSTLQ